MKYKDPITGELRDVIIKSGDTLPIGTIVDFDGDVIPDGYEEATEASDVVNSLEGNDVYRAPSVKTVNEVLNGVIPMGSIVVEDVTCKNIFNKNLYLTDYAPDASNNKIIYSYGAVIIYMPIEGGKTYTFSRKSGVRLRAFTTASIPANGVTISNYQADDTATKMTVNTNSSDKYLCFYCYNYSLETRTQEEAFNEIQIEKGSVSTDYVEHKEFSNKQIYSTNEQVIGTWIDGKPLYRNVLNIGKLPNATSSTIAHNITSIDMIRTNGSFGIANGYSVPIPNASAGSTTNGQIAINVDRTNIYLTTNSNRSDLTGYIILEYTKTTD